MSEVIPPFESRRSAVYSRQGIVASSQPLASQAGVDILSRGGNAADAAIAALATLNVTEPTSTGIGGDCFALFFDAQRAEISALNGSGRAPAGLSLDLLQKEGLGDALPPFHPHTITVPGACQAWSDLIERHGRMKLGEVLAPAIQLAEQGFPVAPITAYFWDRSVQKLRAARGGETFLIGGRAPRAGERFANPDLARTFRTLAESGTEPFYRGAIAEAIVKVVQESGGLMSSADLAQHHSTWDTPISSSYRGHKIWECPPNGQGLTALLALNILEGYDIRSTQPLSVRRLHWIIEALRLAFADARWHIADPTFNPAPLEALLSREYAARQRARIDPYRARIDPRRGSPETASDTVYLAVVDAQGNACSLINSNYMGFGTGIVPQGWGFSLQNRGHNFSLDSEHPNALQPGKRPYHTIIPSMITRPDGGLFACFGVMGGFMQPQGHVQVALALLDDDLDPQSALDRPRLCLAPAAEGGWVGIEAGVSERSFRRLIEMGHPLRRVHGQARALFGRGQVIVRDPQSGVLCAGSDPRADGSAAPVLE